LNRNGSLLGQRIAFATSVSSGGQAIVLARPVNEETPTPLIVGTATPTGSTTPEPSGSVSPTTTLPVATVTATMPGTGPTATPSTATASTATPSQTPVPLVGDANCDDRLSAADVTALILVRATGERSPCGRDDLTGDGEVSSADVDALLDALFGDAAVSVNAGNRYSEHSSFRWSRVAPREARRVSRDGNGVQ
jgi:hypothetical protein